jgi:hypothetical protein
VRVTTPDMQIPFSPALEKQLYPSSSTIAAAVHQVTSGGTTPDGALDSPTRFAPR